MNCLHVILLLGRVKVLGRIKACLVSGVWVLLLFVALFGVALNVPLVRGSGTIYIRADGSIDSPTASISTLDNVTYTLTGNISSDAYASGIVIERSNITIDGNGYTLQSTGMGYRPRGIELEGTQNVTIQNMNVENFGYGVFLNLTSGSTVSGSNITNNQVHGIWLHNSSNNIVIGNNIKDNRAYGLALGYSDNNTISCNNITTNEDGISMFLSSFNNTIYSNNIINNSRYAIEFWHASNNTIQDNSITNNGYGLYFLSSSNNNAYRNNITNNEYGVYLYLSSHHTLSQNIMTSNKYNVYVFGALDLDFFIHSIDVSNIIDEKPIYYLINQEYVAIDPTNYPEVGYLAFINCTNMEVKNLALTNNGQGVLLAYVRNSRIINSNLSSNKHGIYIGAGSSNNTIYEDTVTQNEYGIVLDGCSDNVVTGNKITNNDRGINLNFASYNSIARNSITNNCYGLHSDISSDNRIYENNITDSTCGGLHMVSSSDNSFYHNNLIHNAKQATLPASPYNIWDDSCEGNYWSDYIGSDGNHDGIGDALYEVDPYNIDHYPLMGTFHSFNTSLGCAVDVISNSTIEDFQYFDYNETIIMHVSNRTINQTFGFCRLRIPHALINETYHVTINGTEPYYWNYTLFDDGDNRWIYSSYQHSRLEIIIVSEFPSFLILALFIIATLIAVIVYRKKHAKISGSP
jgi:parallel beta-helix repeat protein